MTEWEGKARNFDALVEINEQRENLGCRIHVLVADDRAVVEAAAQAIFDSRGEPPSESPDKAAFAGKTRPKSSALPEHKSSARQDGRRVSQMLEHRDGEDAVITLVFGISSRSAYRLRICER